MGTFIQVLLALPKIFGMIQTMVKTFKDMQRQSWEKKGDQIATQIQGATTDEERSKLAQQLAKHTSSLP